MSKRSSTNVPSRKSDAFRRGSSPQLRSFIENTLKAFEFRKDAAESLNISPTELTLFAQGARVPSPQVILDLVTLAAANSTETDQPTDFCGALDQRLIDGGYAPVFFKNVVRSDQLLVLRKVGDGFSIEEHPGILPELPDIRFACRRAGVQVALLEDGDQKQYFLLEPVYDDTDLEPGEVALVAKGDRLHFAQLSRNNAGSAFTLLLDPQTMTTLGTVDQEDIDLRARVLVRFTVPGGYEPGPESSKKPRRQSIRGFDKVRVGISPFQDSLLISVGAELGFFEEEGLLVQPESVSWYEWQRFLVEGSEPRIVFGNIFSFVREFKTRPDLRFLYGVNLFDNGFSLLTKHSTNDVKGEGTLTPGNLEAHLSRYAIGSPVKIPIGTIAESDWAAQLYSLCVAEKFNLVVGYGPVELHVYPEEGPIPDRPTIAISDSNRETGVVTDPAFINDKETFYFGSMPQRLRLINEFGWNSIPGVTIRPPFPVNGFVGRQDIYERKKDILLRFLRVWFRIVNYIQPELRGLIKNGALNAQSGSRLIQRALESGFFEPNVAKLRVISTPREYVNEVVDAWRLELFPANPFEIERSILGREGCSPWREDAKRAIRYLGALYKQKEPTLHPKLRELQTQLELPDDSSGMGAFLLNAVHHDYVARYGRGQIVRKELGTDPLPNPINRFPNQ